MLELKLSGTQFWIVSVKSTWFFYKEKTNKDEKSIRYAKENDREKIEKERKVEREI